jgi:hypothetical protein
MGVDDVEAAAPVHEYFSEACVGDDGIDDERVDSRIGDVVWMFITVESDGHVEPIKEEGVAKRTKKTSRCSRLHWRAERRVEGPSYIMK